MTIYTTNLYTNNIIGSSNALYANILNTSNGFSNLSVNSDLHVDGSVFTNKRMDVGYTVFMEFRPLANIPFTSNTLVITSNLMIPDFTSSDMSAMSNLPMSQSNVYNASNGVINVPISGFYALEMQGSFSNSVPGSTNGVYYKFLKTSASNARMAANFATHDLVSTSTTTFLLQGDQILPTFYSSDSNTFLISSAKESYVGFTLLATVTPLHSNYVRV